MSTDMGLTNWTEISWNDVMPGMTIYVPGTSLNGKVSAIRSLYSTGDNVRGYSLHMEDNNHVHRVNKFNPVYTRK